VRYKVFDFWRWRDKYFDSKEKAEKFAKSQSVQGALVIPVKERKKRK